VTRATHDTLFEGRVALAQPARGEGYRVNVDALLLADFARRAGEAARAKSAFDLGAGVGAVSLALLYWGAVERIALVEIDPLAAELAAENLRANGWAERGEVIAADVARVAAERRGEARLVVCNPPYFAPGRGRPPTSPARKRARSGELRGFVDAARALLGIRGRVCFVYPARELASLFEALRAAGLEPKRMRLVRASAEDAARVVLIEAMAAKAGGLVIERDCIERDGGAVAAEVGQIIAGTVSGANAHARVASRPQDQS
jgi:tRNA1Val (adenine37-N6)-methyltransferase